MSDATVAPLLDHGCLIVHGPDQPGLVATISDWISRIDGNIVSLDQYSDNPAGGAFFQRVVFHKSDLSAALPDLREQLVDLLEPYTMQWQLTDRSIPKRMAILASTADHCLLELLWRHRRGELPVTIPMVIANHTNTEEDVRSFGVPFFHVPSQGADKSAAEAAILELLIGNVDFVVLARYMQILTDGFLDKLGVPVINIHHSFLPAFIGAAPYKRAKERGVKLIGATSHYVTADLDEGPIIEQDVARVDHRMSAADLQARGAYVERAVLSRAVQWHAEDRVIRHGNQTIVF
ncbi:formyltetrahydrofolate deformylase [Leifsonia shinshuensis]|uniref:Formyltetrahydrofolate deformylase n=1 Tax=Leifsonia shinshuensis TaxID=150026 RepID=A0A853CYK5_9MICO|nr:formyltetrahydrofolate deformylase [Leifsonia shinshuensis]NYJ25628.1 formyltetrahydrofolate deformylase [Leifsonia shinshuensis]